MMRRQTDRPNRGEFEMGSETAGADTGRPRTLAENAGLHATDVLSALYAAHAAGNSRAGVDIENGGVRDLGQDGLFDVYATKQWAIRLATEAVTTILRVDQLIMSKQAVSFVAAPRALRRGRPGGR